MNGGLIASRYATAFNSLVASHGVQDKAYGQARRLLLAMRQSSKFRIALTVPKAVAVSKRIDLLRAALSPEEMCPEIGRLLELMCRNFRDEYFLLTLLDFVNLYRSEHGVGMMEITTAVPIGGLEEKAAAVMKEKTGLSAEVVCKTDPSILGGIIIDSWGVRADASVRTSLRTIYKQLLGNNKKTI